MKTTGTMTIPGRCSSAGFTMIELMVAMTISLVVLAALVSLFVNMSRSTNELAKTNSLIENGRFAIQLLQDDVVHAGYWGGYIPEFDDLSVSTVPADTPTAIPNPCQLFSTWDTAYLRNLLGIPVQANDALPTGAGCVSLLNKRADTDVLIVRHAETCLPGAGLCDADSAGRLYMQASYCDVEKDAGLQYVLDTSSFDLHKMDCTGASVPVSGGTVADKRRFISNLYYIKDIAHPDRPTEIVPTLVRSQLDLSGSIAHQEPVALIEGIEAMRVELGLDDLSDSGAAVDYTAAVDWDDPSNLTSPTNRGDGIPDSFVRCTTAAPCTAAQLTNVVAVKLYVLARSREPTPGYTDTKTYCLGEPNSDGTCPTANEIAAANDQYKRHVFTTSIRLTNISGRRETP